MKTDKSDTLNMPKIVSCCVVLHDVCEMFGKECPDDWIALDIQDEVDLTHLTSSSTSLENAIQEALFTILILNHNTHICIHNTTRQFSIKMV